MTNKRQIKKKLIPSYAAGGGLDLQAGGGVSGIVGSLGTLAEVGPWGKSTATTNAEANALTAQGIFKGAAAGAKIGSIAGPVGGIIGGVAGAAFGAVGKSGGVQQTEGYTQDDIGTLSTGLKGLFGGRSADRRAIRDSQIQVMTNKQALAQTNEMRNDYYSLSTLGQYQMAAEGGMINSSLAYLDDGELLQTPDGSIQEIPEQGQPTDSNLMMVPDGTRILSDKLKVPGTKKTFAEMGKKLMKPSKAKQTDRFAENSAMLNDRNNALAYEALYNEQELMKAKRGIKPKMKDAPAYSPGGTVPEKEAALEHKIRLPMSLDERMQGIFGIRHEMDNTSIDLRESFDDNKLLTKGRRQDIHMPGSITVFGETFRTDVRGDYLNSDWHNLKTVPLSTNKAPTGNEDQVKPDSTDIEQKGTVTEKVDKPKGKREVKPASTAVTPKITPLDAKAHQAIMQSSTKGDGSWKMVNGKMIKDTGMAFKNEIAKPRELESAMQGKGIQTSNITPMNLPRNPYVAPEKESASWQLTAGDITDGLMQFGSLVGNMFPGKAQTVAARYNPYEDLVLKTMRNRRYNINQPLRALERNRGYANYNNRLMNTGTGANLAFNAHTARANQNAAMDLYAQQATMLNQFDADYANMANSLGQQRVQADLYAQDWNARSTAANRAFRRQASIDLNNFASNQSLMRNQRIRDNQMMQMYRPFLESGYSRDELNRIWGTHYSA